jgi:serine/threonine protein kinase
MTAPGAFIAGRYRLVKRIATGGMGLVWEARDELLQRRVAVKQLLAQPGMSPDDTAMARNRVIREARITARLHHPHAVTLYDVVEQSGNPCLIMQYVPSRSLSSILQERGTLEPAVVARIGGEVASALAAAHEVGIVHRDVKPSNVLISPDGSAKLTDFGISHAAGDVNLTSTGMVSGTPAYLAPEVARGGMSGFPADVFSLGATLYTALEGAPPFGTDPNPMALLHRVASGEPIPPHRSGSLTPLLVRMLAVEPGDRPAMSEVAATLASLQNANPAMSEANGATLAGPARTRRVWPDEEGSVEENNVDESSDEPTPPAGVSALVPGFPARPIDPAPRRRRPVGAMFAGVLALLVTIGILIAWVVLGRGDSDRNATGQTGPSQSAASQPADSRPRTSPPTTGSSAGAVGRPSAPSKSPKSSVAAALPATKSTPTSTSTTVLAQHQTRAASKPATPSTSTSVAGRTVAATTSREGSAPKTTAHSTDPNQQTEAAGPATAGQLARAVEDYYALMPDNTDAGWSRLTEKFQTGTAHNRQYYENFWAGIDRVDISDAVGEPPNGAVATITYHFANGQVSVERTEYTLVRQDGIWKIDTSEVISAG